MILVRNNKEKPIIFIDVDDTIADTRAAIAQLYYRETGKRPLSPRSTKTKRYCDFCPLWSDAKIAELFEEGQKIYNVAEPLRGAVEGVRNLIQKGYDVRIVTMHSPKSIKYKHAWLERYFPELQNKVYYVDWNIGNKDVFVGYSIIDDDLKNIAHNESRYPILLDFYDIYSEQETRGIVCKSWEEIIKKL